MFIEPFEKVAAKTTVFKARTWIYCQGNAANGAYMIHSGIVFTSGTTHDGDIVAYNIHRAGDWLGLEDAFTQERTRHQMAVAMTDSSVMHIPTAKLIDTFAPEKLMAGMSWIIQQRNVLQAIRQRSSTESVPAMLTYLFNYTGKPGYKDQPTLPYKLTRAAMGELLGIRRESALKALQVLERNGMLLEDDLRHYYTPDIEALAAASKMPRHSLGFVTQTHSEKPRASLG